MRLSDPVAEGDLVGWNDPHKKGPQMARVRDVAGPWVLIEPQFGRRRRTWIRRGQLVLSMMPKPDPAQQARAMLKLAGVLPLEEGDPPLLPEVGSPEWLKCLVCAQPLRRLRVETTVSTSTKPVNKWMYCPACDRVQRLP